MGGRVARMFRNFNLENRVHREISREKPRLAPRHEADVPASASSPHVETVSRKDDPLLDLLKAVYVESKDPVAEAQKEVPTGPEEERRPLKYSLPSGAYSLEELTEVPKGKLTIAEALRALSRHQQQPQTWTPAKIAQEYSLNLNDTKALLEFFIPFQVHIIPPKTEGAKQVKAS